LHFTQQNKAFLLVIYETGLKCSLGCLLYWWIYSQ